MFQWAVYDNLHRDGDKLHDSYDSGLMLIHCYISGILFLHDTKKSRLLNLFLARWTNY